MTAIQFIIFGLSLAFPLSLAIFPEIRGSWCSVFSRKIPSFLIILSLASIFFTTQTISGIDSTLGPLRIIRIAIIFFLAIYASLRILQRPSRMTRAGSPVLVLLIYGILAMLSASYSPIPALSLWKGFEVFTIVLVAISLSDTLRTLDGLTWLISLFRLIFIFFVCDLVFSVLLAPGQAFTDFEISSGRMAFAASGIAPPLHPNSATQIGALLVAATLATILNSPPRSSPIICWFLVGLGAATMVLSHSRTSLFSCVVALLVILIYEKHFRTSILLVFLGAVVFFLTPSPEFITEFVMRGQDIEAFQSMSGRTYYWEEVWELTKEKPLIGHGFYAGQRQTFGRSTVDNTYLEVLMNLGVIGLTIFVLPVLLSMVTLYRYRPNKRTPQKYRLAWLQLVSFYIIIFIRSLSGPSFQVLNHSLIFFSIILVAISALRVSRSTQLRPPLPPLSPTSSFEVAPENRTSL